MIIMTFQESVNNHMKAHPASIMNRCGDPVESSLGRVVEDVLDRLNARWSLRWIIEDAALLKAGL